MFCLWHFGIPEPQACVKVQNHPCLNKGSNGYLSSAFPMYTQDYVFKCWPIHYLILLLLFDEVKFRVAKRRTFHMSLTSQSRPGLGDKRPEINTSHLWTIFQNIIIIIKNAYSRVDFSSHYILLEETFLLITDSLNNSTIKRYV